MHQRSGLYGDMQNDSSVIAGGYGIGLCCFGAKAIAVTRPGS